MWGFRGVTVSTSDSESDNPSSNLGGTFFHALYSFYGQNFFQTMASYNIYASIWALIIIIISTFLMLNVYVFNSVLWMDAPLY